MIPTAKWRISRIKDYLIDLLVILGPIIEKLSFLIVALAS